MAIPVLKDVFCMSLRTGCLIIGCMGIVVSIMALFALFIMAIMTAFVASTLNNNNIWEQLENQNQELNSKYGSELGNEYSNHNIQNPYNNIFGQGNNSAKDILKVAATVATVSMIIYGIVGFGTLLVSSCLIHGTRKGNPSLLVPFLVWAPFVPLLLIFLVIFPIVMISIAYGYSNIVPLIFWIGIVGFFWVVVYSHKKELSNPEAQYEMANRNAGVVHGVVHYKA